MKTVKVMSIIGMVFFPICVLLASVFIETDVDAAVGWGVFAGLYGIGFAITAFLQVNKHLKAVAN